MKKSQQSYRSLQRRESTREPRRLFLIVCEGRKTEPNYFNFLAKQWRLTSMEVKIVDGFQAGSAPKSVVDYAARRKKDARRDGLEYDEVWCVMDVECPPHKTINQAVIQAGDNNLNLAWSNPCFELWLILHYEKFARQTNTQKMISELKKHIPGYKKGDSGCFEAIFDLTDKAIANAKAILREKGATEALECNPGTDVYKLVESLRNIDNS